MNSRIDTFIIKLIFSSIILCVSYSGFSQNTLGVILNSEKSNNGYTLFGNNEVTYLIDNCGSIVNRWESDFKTGHGMYLLENGDLLRAGRVEGQFDAGGAGGIIEIFDWNGDRKWSYMINDESQQAHHDLAPLPNGNFLVTVWDRYSEEEAHSKGRKFNGEVWSEKIVEISPLNTDEADIVWEWKVWDHLIQDHDPALPGYGVVSEHPERININYIGTGESSGNWLHMNSIDYNPQLDQVMVSNRLWSEVWIIDHSTTSEEARSSIGGRYNKGGDLLYRYGNPSCYGLGDMGEQSLFGQHDAHWIPESLPLGGNIMIFNNEYVSGQQSSVEVYSPHILEDGSYNIDRNGVFGPNNTLRSIVIDGIYSDILSSAQMLDNGNVLICEGRQGRFVEITVENEKVWEYINPVNRNGDAGIDGAEPRMNMTWRVLRYPVNYRGLADRDLTPGTPVEKSPANFDCTLWGTTSNNKVQSDGILLEVINSLVRGELMINAGSSTSLSARIIDISGQVRINITMNHGLNYINVEILKPGIHFLVLNNNSYAAQIKFLKI